jgi:ribose/xylose/arabinose/galactoside ABC-type transport system permease subunit
VNVEQPASQSWLQIRAHFAGLARTRMATTRAIVLGALLVWAALTPSFLSAPSLTALLTTASVIGCLSAGMTFITISGNVMSFALGATAASSAVVFLLLLNAAGIVPALIGALLFGGAVTGFQGLVVGWIRANPIIVSIAANVLIYGAFTWLTGNESVNADANAGHSVLKSTIGGVPIEFLIFITAIAVGQIVLSYTVFGRNLLLIGSGLPAAEAVGLPITPVVFGAYFCAGVLSALSGILLAIRYNQANMSFAVHYDYDAIAAVLVGGTPIQGGDGSMIRTLIGVAAISVIQVVLLLHGFEEEWRYFVTGLIVLLVIILYSGRRA